MPDDFKRVALTTSFLERCWQLGYHKVYVGTTYVWGEKHGNQDHYIRRIAQEHKIDTFMPTLTQGSYIKANSIIEGIYDKPE